MDHSYTKKQGVNDEHHSVDPFDSFYSNNIEQIHSNEYNEFDNPDYQLITIITDPPDGKWKFPPMYKIGARGEDRYYQVGFDGSNVVTQWGQAGGAITSSRNKVILNESGRNLSNQAMIVARNLFLKYCRKNYREQGSTVARIKEPMTGHRLEDAKDLTLPVALEVKFNGVRGLFEMNDTGQIQVRSRGNKLYTQFDHICKYMYDLFMYFPPGTILDSEIYNNGLHLEDISGNARTINSKAKLADDMIAYVFDIILPDNPVFEERKDYLAKVFNIFIEHNKYDLDKVPIEIVPYQVAYSMDEIYKFHDWAISEGYEGTVVKRMSAGTANKSMCKYKGGKSGRFYKLKDDFDEEGIILEVLDCTGKESGCARFKIIDPRGNIFTVRPIGNYTSRRELYKLKDKLVGHLYKYKCSGLTKYGVPEHPRGVGIRDDLDTEKVIENMRLLLSKLGKCICTYLGGKCDICIEKSMEQLKI